MLARLTEMAADLGLGVRGAFHPLAKDQVPLLADGRAVGTLVMLGWAGGLHWPKFASSSEYADGKPHPLDRWSRRMIVAMAEKISATPVFPFDGPPYRPFQHWAMRADAVFRSPLGLLIHPEFGLWHSYRGALLFAETLALPKSSPASSPCESCAEKPCLSTCPVGAFTANSYAVDRCRAHVASDAGTPCATCGCLARRACPIGEGYRYTDAEQRFYMAAFAGERRYETAGPR